MIVTLITVARDTNTVVSVSGEVITVDGIDYDLSTIPDESQVEAKRPAVGTIKRIDGVINISVLYKYNMDEAAPMQSRDAPIFDITEGLIPCPIIRNNSEGVDV